MPLEARFLLAQEILTLLEQTNRRLVCAESCTAGLVSATLAGIPGASQWLCGSAVVYRNATKMAWIGVTSEILNDPARGDVCEETAIQMGGGVLSVTPEASVAVSVTGHLGPSAPTGLDGLIFIGWAERDLLTGDLLSTHVQRVRLQEPPPIDREGSSQRIARQSEATQCVLQVIRDSLLRIVSTTHN